MELTPDYRNKYTIWTNNWWSNSKRVGSNWISQLFILCDKYDRIKKLIKFIAKNKYLYNCFYRFPGIMESLIHDWNCSLVFDNYSDHIVIINDKQMKESIITIK